MRDKQKRINITLRTALYTLAILLFIGAGQQTYAATYTVNELGDAGDGTCDATCTLRDAILAANATADDDVIEFSVTGTITLSGTELTITNNGTLTINGPGASLLTVSGNNTSRVFFINTSATATIDGLTISNGNGAGADFGYGGGIYTDTSSTLTLTNSTVSNNSTSLGGGIGSFGTLTVNNSTIDNNNSPNSGGGILSVGSLTVTNSTISNNSAASSGGGGFRIAGGGTITNSTISNNSAPFAGGISNEGASNVLTITNSTISNNSVSGNGGGIYNNQADADLINSIVANSTGGDCLNIVGGSTNASYSLVQDGSCGVMDGVNNNKTGDPALGPLQDNGGPTLTHALLVGSPAIDAADPNNFPPTDQRGFLRPADGGTPLHLSGGNSQLSPTALLPDMGSFERLAPSAASATISGRVLSSNGRGVPRATVHITDQSGNIKTAQTNQFGYYRFTNIGIGQTLIVNVYSKRYQFETQVINFDDSVTDMNFIAQGGGKSKTSHKKRE